MQGSGVRRSRSGVRDGKVIARLEEFAGACAQARPGHRAGPPGSRLGACLMRRHVAAQTGKQLCGPMQPRGASILLYVTGAGVCPVAPGILGATHELLPNPVLCCRRWASSRRCRRARLHFCMSCRRSALFEMHWL